MGSGHSSMVILETAPIGRLDTQLLTTHRVRQTFERGPRSAYGGRKPAGQCEQDRINRPEMVPGGFPVKRMRTR